MKFILQKNVQSLIFIIQKLCFYYEYGDKYEFSLKNINLFYTNIIEINDKRFRHISLLPSQTTSKNNSLDTDKKTVYFNVRKNKKSEKLNEDFHKIYNEYISYVFNSSPSPNIPSQKLSEAITEGNKIYNNYLQLINEIRNLFNDEPEKLEQSKNNLKKTNSQDDDKQSNHKKQRNISREKILGKIISKFDARDNAEHLLWFLFHGLFIDKIQILEKYPLCYKYHSFSPSQVLTGEDTYFPGRLFKGTVYFNHPKNFNDPFDINCFKNSSGNIDKNATERDLFRVFCSTQHFDNILMWSHYGANHTGYCLEYDTESIISSLMSEFTHINLMIVGNVIYTDRRKIIESRSFNKRIKSRPNLTELINAAFKKSRGWKYEAEFRFVIMNFKGFRDWEASDKGITLSNAIVKNIYLGAEIKQRDELYVTSCIKKLPSISCKKMKLDKKKYKIQ